MRAISVWLFVIAFAAEDCQFADEGILLQLSNRKIITKQAHDVQTEDAFEEEPGDVELWPQFQDDSLVCEPLVSMLLQQTTHSRRSGYPEGWELFPRGHIRGQLGCQLRAMERGHPFYGYVNTNGGVCATYASCTSPVASGRRLTHRIYANPSAVELWPQFREDSLVCEPLVSMLQQQTTHSRRLGYPEGWELFPRGHIRGQLGCQLRAIERGHPFYGYVNTNGGVCATYASCTSPVASGRRLTHRIYSSPQLRYTIDGCSEFDVRDGEHPLTGHDDPATTADVRCCSHNGTEGRSQHFAGGVEWHGSAGCMFDKTFTEARSICASVNMRLCAQQEVDVACRTGCWHDAHAVWIDTPVR